MTHGTEGEERSVSIEQCVCGGYPPEATNPDCERCQLIDKLAAVTAELAETKERLAAAEDDVNTVLRAACHRTKKNFVRAEIGGNFGVFGRDTDESSWLNAIKFVRDVAGLPEKGE